MGKEERKGKEIKEDRGRERGIKRGEIGEEKRERKGERECI
jgi:hypothetical protein